MLVLFVSKLYQKSEIVYDLKNKVSAVLQFLWGRTMLLVAMLGCPGGLQRAAPDSFTFLGLELRNSYFCNKTGCVYRTLMLCQAPCQVLREGNLT